MINQSFGQRLVAARVLRRYAGQRPDADLNKSVVVALEKWIERKPKRRSH